MEENSDLLDDVEFSDDTLTKEEIAELRKEFNRERLAHFFSSDKTDWETPNWFFSAVNSEFHFDLDAAATMENRKVKKFFSPHQDAFRLQWKGNVWLNPPYGRGIGRWIAKAQDEAYLRRSTVVCLVPARTDTNWWFDYARFAEVRFLKGRIKFVGADNGANFPSALLIFRPRGNPPRTSYWHYREVKYAPYYEFGEVSSVK